MNIVFIHPHFPGQFGLLAETFGKDPVNQTIFITSTHTNRQIPGVQQMIYSEKPFGKEGEPLPTQPPGLAVANILADLKQKNYIPDLIVGYSGPSILLYIKDLFPDTPFLGFFDWFYNPGKIQDNATAGPNLKTRMSLRNKNLTILSDLCGCDHGICPTDWQKNQFPGEFHSKLSRVHDGIDTTYFHPSKEQKFKNNTLDLSGVKQLVTYTANVLAPYLGFQQFMEALPGVLEEKPEAHVAIVGRDRVSLEDKSGTKKSYKSIILEKVKLDPQRVHFIESLTHQEYRTLLQASTVHVYLDSPLVISRSLLEAMACECLVIASDILPVREIITDGANGIMADFSSPEKITEKIVACLDYPSFMQAVKQKARQTIVDRYSIDKTLARQLEIIQKLTRQDKQPPPST